MALLVCFQCLCLDDVRAAFQQGQLGILQGGKESRGPGKAHSLQVLPGCCSTATPHVVENGFSWVILNKWDYLFLSKRVTQHAFNGWKRK